MSMVWGYVMDSGIGEMYICGGRMDCTKYINVLEFFVFGDTNTDGVKLQQDMP